MKLRSELIYCYEKKCMFFFSIDANTIVTTINNYKLEPPAALFQTGHIHTSLSPRLEITRTGFIKQWKYYSTRKGPTLFYILRRDPKLKGFK